MNIMDTNTGVPSPRRHNNGAGAATNISLLDDSQKEEELNRIAEEIVKSLDPDLLTIASSRSSFDYEVFHELLWEKTNRDIDSLDYEPAELGDIGGFRDRVVKKFLEKIDEHYEEIKVEFLRRCKEDLRAQGARRTAERKRMAELHAEKMRKAEEKRRNAIMDLRDKLDAHRAAMERLNADLAQLNIADGNVANRKGSMARRRQATRNANEEQAVDLPPVPEPAGSMARSHQATRNTNEEQAVDPSPVPGPVGAIPPPANTVTPRRSRRLQGLPPLPLTTIPRDLQIR